MGHYGGYTEADFIRLLDVLSTVKGKFLLSSYPNVILSDYTRKNGWHTIAMQRSAGGGTKTEVLTMNYSGAIAKQSKIF